MEAKTYCLDCIHKHVCGWYPKDCCSSHAEPLTDKEQRIFLAAMRREEKVCKEVDEQYIKEPYEESLVKACEEIERKVKKALWTS